MKGGLILVSSVILFTQVVWGCPDVCQCHASSKTVDCRNRGYVEMPHSLPPDTQILYLQDNHIRTINQTAFSMTPWLTILDLSNNSLSSLPPGAFHDLLHLQVLNLTGNSIQHLEGRLLAQQADLRELDLSYNTLVNLPESLLNNTRNLTFIAVSHNQLQRLDRFFLDSLANLKVFLFKDNPWQCNCHVLGLKLWLESFLYRGGTIDELICSEPENREGKHLLKIPYETYATCPPTTGHVLLSSLQHHSPDHRTAGKYVHHGEHGDGAHSDCEPKPKPRPASLRHAIATVVITGVVCGIVCLMMLAAAVYGCAYAAIMAKYHRDMKEVEHLPPAIEQGSPEEKEPLDCSQA
ncbi:leucine-rich repeat and transmembrane domain-containing protein 1 [Ambystoma mexicanum]|uniref:leucine-rich repeat and transmembrane domain-containing protein 1 n=1 Tax=Ambystoma mexicanum TaxID=8296 RepID=UPI0037E92EAF